MECARAMHNYKERNRTTRLTRDGNAISCNSSWNALKKSFSTLLTSTCEPSYLCRLRHLQSPWRFDLIVSSTRVIASPPPIFSCPRHPRATLRSAPRAKRSLFQISADKSRANKHNTNDVQKNKPHLWQLKCLFLQPKRYMKIEAMFLNHPPSKHPILIQPIRLTMCLMCTLKRGSIWPGMTNDAFSTSIFPLFAPWFLEETLNLWYPEWEKLRWIWLFHLSNTTIGSASYKDGSHRLQKRRLFSQFFCESCNINLAKL